jgi:hypothetical protein
VTETLFEKLLRQSRAGEIPLSPQFIVEQQVKSGLGQLVWLKVAGPTDDEVMAQAIAGKHEKRTGLPTRVVPLAQALEVKA